MHTYIYLHTYLRVAVAKVLRDAVAAAAAQRGWTKFSTVSYTIFDFTREEALD